jgi:predicted RNA polymerase sigma factor
VAAYDRAAALADDDTVRAHLRAERDRVRTASGS